MPDFYYTVDDFADYDSTKKLIDKYGANTNDSNGFTPLCFAVLNNVDPLILVLLCTAEDSYSQYDTSSEPSDWKKYTGFGADLNAPCDKGKSPIEYAVMSSNIDAVNILSGKKIVDVVNVKLVGKAKIPVDIIKYDNGMPVRDSDGNLEYEHVNIGINPSDSLYLDKAMMKKMIFDASSLTKPDLLNALIEINNSRVELGILLYDTEIDNTCHATSKYFNDYNYTPLMMATSAQSYGSIDSILSNINQESEKCLAIHEIHDKIMDQDGTDQSAFDIADSICDTGAMNKFNANCSFCISGKSCIDAIAYVDSFITETKNGNTVSYSAESVDNLIIEPVNYCYLNLLHIRNKLVEEIDGETVANASANKLKIINAVSTEVLDYTLLMGWPWWEDVPDPDEEIGTIAFVTDTFAVDPDPSTIETRINNKIVQLNVRQEWEKTYDRSNGYTRQQVPQPPFSLIYKD